MHGIIQIIETQMEIWIMSIKSTRQYNPHESPVTLNIKKVQQVDSMFSQLIIVQFSMHKRLIKLHMLETPLIIKIKIVHSQR